MWFVVLLRGPDVPFEIKLFGPYATIEAGEAALTVASAAWPDFRQCLLKQADSLPA